MKSLKEEALRVIESMPDNAQIDEVMYRLYVIDKIAKGEQAIKDEKYQDTENLLKEIDSW